ncbi:MAG: DUF192 domain-containing protein [Chloroflexi bacterium]|nr:DUF192 domain-containing protein [Chloroflexota bacterium]
MVPPGLRWVGLLLLLGALACRSGDASTPRFPSRTPTASPAPPSPAPTPSPQQPVVVLEGVPFAVELAITPQERARGLAGRERLESGQGMLFLFEADGTPGFWMRGMLISLDMVWLDARGVVVGVTPDVPPVAPDASAPLYFPPRPVRYVLEIAAGRAAAAGIRPGSQAVFRGVPLPEGER